MYTKLFLEQWTFDWNSCYMNIINLYSTVRVNETTYVVAAITVAQHAN